MENEKKLTDSEVNAMIENYLNDKKQPSSTKNVVNSKPIVKQVEMSVSGMTYSNSTADEMIENHFNTINENKILDGIVSKGASHVMSIIIENKFNTGDHKMNVKILSKFDTRGMDAVDFAILMNDLIYYKAYDKIKSYVDYLQINPNLSLEEGLYFVKNSFTSYAFENESQKLYVKSLLKF